MMNDCELAKLCWRYAYSRYLVEAGWSGSPPDRMTLFFAGYATQEMMPRSGIFAEVFPHKNVDGIVGLCPVYNRRGRKDDCEEYEKETKKRVSIQDRATRAKAKHRREWIPQEIRKQVAQRDRFKCVYCGVSVNRTRCHVDHVVALAKGGGNDEGNLALTCVPCNQAKGTDIWSFGCRM